MQAEPIGKLGAALGEWEFKYGAKGIGNILLAEAKEAA